MDTPAPRPRGRPRQTASDTAEALVRAGVAMLTEKGYSATGLDEILKSCGITKGSFYHHFGSKEQFGQVIVARYAAYFAQRLDQFLLDASRPPLARLAAFMDDAALRMARYGFRRGCLVGNLGQEMNALPESFRMQLAEVFADWQARVAACLAEAQCAGDMPPGADPAQCAAFFWIGWEGAVLRAKLETNDQPLRLFAQGFMALTRAGI